MHTKYLLILHHEIFGFEKCSKNRPYVPRNLANDFSAPVHHHHRCIRLLSLQSPYITRLFCRRTSVLARRLVGTCSAQQLLCRGTALSGCRFVCTYPAPIYCPDPLRARPRLAPSNTSSLRGCDYTLSLGSADPLQACIQAQTGLSLLYRLR